MRTIIINLMRRSFPLVLASALAITGCGSGGSSGNGSAAPSIVVTHSVLGAIVSDLVLDSADVTVLIPNGIDPHEWEPSAKDVEAINSATLVVANGLDLEEALNDVLDNAESPVFFAADHITPLTSSDSHDHAHDDEHAHDEEAKAEDDDHAHDDEHEHGEGDPHFWTDPVSVAEVVEHLSEELATVGLDVSSRADALIADLNALDGEVSELLSVIPDEKRVMITGHVSMAYFAAHYGFELLGSVVPNLSTSAEASAANLAELKDVIADEGVSVIFAELGAPDDVVSALADEAGVRVVVLPSHLVPDEGTYRSFLLALASEVRDALTA
jgi:zinc/manganese transport system substrate-binding protein